MTQVKKLDFSGTTIYCGVDVHKKSWRDARMINQALPPAPKKNAPEIFGL
jgi:hypothetical protein